MQSKIRSETISYRSDSKTLERKNSLCIAVPSYNEENTIVSLIHTLLSLEIPEICQLNQIFISDCSTDRTCDLLRAIQKQNQKIIVSHHDRRTGINAAINEIFENGKSDFLFYINADAVPSTNSIRRLVEPLIRDGSIGATSGSMVPIPRGKSISEEASVFGASLMEKLRPISYSFHGRMFMIRGSLAGCIRLPSDAIEQDAYISCSVRERGFRIEYVPEAVCYYTPPSALRDYLLPNRIYRTGIQVWRAQFPKWEKAGLLRGVDKITAGGLIVVFRQLTRDPSRGALWIFLKLLESIYPARQMRFSALLKPIARTTKHLPRPCRK